MKVQVRDYRQAFIRLEAQLAERNATVAALKAEGHCVHDAERELRRLEDTLCLVR